MCCHKFKPQNMTDVQILGHKLLGPNAVGQSYKDFYVK